MTPQCDDWKMLFQSSESVERYERQRSLIENLAEQFAIESLGCLQHIEDIPKKREKMAKDLKLLNNVWI